MKVGVHVIVHVGVRVHVHFLVHVIANVTVHRSRRHGAPRTPRKPTTTGLIE